MTLFVDKIAQHAIEQPDKIAIKGMGEEFSYLDLDRITDMVASELIDMGVKPNDKVGVLHERHVNVFLGAIGCWKARAAYFYMDVKLPEEAQSRYIADSGCKLVIDRAFIDAIKAKYYDNPVDTEKQEKGKPEDYAWILYTSGSTGQSKGVLLNQKNIVNHMNVAKSFQLTKDTKQSMLASFSFMSGLMEGFPILFCGGTIHMIPTEYRRDAEKIVQFWKDEEINVGFVPSHFAEIITNQELDLPHFKSMLTGGEPAHNLGKQNFNVFICYGSSECGGPVCVHNANYTAKDYPIGNPIPKIELYLEKEDGTGQVTEPGAIGEICVAGPQVSLGYMNKPELTAEIYRKNPYSDDPDFAVLLHTHDLGRMDENGEIYYVARMDLMCKIKSFRIELGAVENAMLQFPGIERCVAKGLYDSCGKKDLHGFYYSQQDIDEAELREFMRSRILHYMVPEYFHRIDKLELTENGKVDRKSVVLDGYRED